jgi:hypothetical protein
LLRRCHSFAEAQDSQLNVVLFQSKYVRDLSKDSNFPANAVEKAVNAIKCVFDPAANVELNPESKEKVQEIRSFILDGQIPYVTFVMMNNGLKWCQNGQNHIDNAFKGQTQVTFEHYSHSDIIRYIDKTKDIDTQLTLKGKAIQENFNYKRVILGRMPIMQISTLKRRTNMQDNSTNNKKQSRLGLFTSGCVGPLV